ncbi:hypothetical protein VB834_01395 [Limnoraphis robusta Tam1]|uniref:hypothetical protein n=1 Tax=Limnoraphis robusta TaxID=1118279 RepID=UPI002B1FD6D4|nr:hypothetical protein [Limnoraphis robusta]MEA5537680.1 hypothetical protein [Limnoraphis robusta Tam1]
MNRFLITALAIPSLFSLLQSCSLNFPSKNASAQAEQTHQSHQNHSDNNNTQPAHSTQHSDSTNHQHHQQHSTPHSDSLSVTKAQLTKPAEIIVNQPQTFLIAIQDKTGKPITEFETFQEKLMHLIVVSDNLEVFDHLHPEYQGEGVFEAKITFPKPGNYSLVSDYKPLGENEQVSVLNAQVPGIQLSSSVKIDQNMIQTLENTEVSLTPSQAVIKSGEDVTLKFNLKDTKTNQPINDLKPYLGERGHLVIFKQSAPLTKADYIHAHALQNTPSNEVHFMTKFPQPGTYKVWGQFNRDGKIVTSSFWLQVS